eukprot:gene9439-10425_t
MRPLLLVLASLLFFCALSLAFSPSQRFSSVSRGAKHELRSSKNNWSWLKSASKDVSQPPKKLETIVIPENYNVALGFTFSGLLAFAASSNIFLSGFLIVFGLFLLRQTSKVRFVFDEEAIEVVVSKGKGYEQSRENFAVGGRNRWKYDTITKWFFIPSKELPILVYFNEIQTKPEGQLHLFPVLMDGKRLFQAMDERFGKKI